MSFVAPLFLAGLAALAMPWLLHRFSFQDPEQQPFPSTRFLEAVPPPVSRRRKLRHKLLLAARWLLLALLCLAFARPWLSSLGDTGDGRAMHMIVMDRSLSMRAGTRFEDAVEAADDVLAALPTDDPVRLFAADDRLVELNQDQTSVTAARSELSSLQPGDSRLDVGVVMRRLDTLASEANLPVNVHFLTDVQQSALPVRRNELFAPSVDQFELVSVAEDAAAVNARLSATATTPDEALLRVVVQLEALGASEPVTREFVVAHEGRELVRETVELPPGAPVERVYDDLAMPGVASPVLDVAFVDQDAIAEDDAVRVAIARNTARRVAVAGFGVPLPDSPEVFVGTALQSGAEAGVESLSNAASGLPEDTRHAVVFARADDAQAMADIKRQTDRGVNVLVVPVASAGTSASSDDTAATASVKRVDTVHPIALGELSWSAVRFYAEIVFASEPDDQVLIDTTLGHPLLVERASTDGRLLILNDPLDGQTSNLPYEPVFVDLIERVIDWFDAADAVPASVYVGETLVLPARAQVFAPDGAPMAGLGDAGAVTSLELRERGVHRVLDSRGERFVHVVVDPRESDLSLMDEQTRDAWRSGHSADAAVEDTTSTPQDTALFSRDQTPQDRPLWHFLLLGVAVLMIAESVFGNRRLTVRRDGS